MLEKLETIKSLLFALFGIVILALFYNRFRNKDFIEGKPNEVDGSNKN